MICLTGLHRVRSQAGGGQSLARWAGAGGATEEGDKWAGLPFAC